MSVPERADLRHRAVERQPQMPSRSSTLFRLNRRLFLTFAVYVAICLCFAISYHVLYLRYPQHFLFNADIVHRQTTLLREQANDALQDTIRDEALVQELQELLSSGPKPRIVRVGPFDTAQEAIYTSPSREFVFYVSTFASVRGMAAADISLRIRDLAGNVITDLLLPPEGWASLRVEVDVHRDWIVRLAEQLRENRQAAASTVLAMTEQEPRVWNYVDFLYFSVITQATVGYGDIVPNSSAVRILVIAQTTIGLVLLVVVLNLVVRPGRRPPGVPAA